MKKPKWATTNQKHAKQNRLIIKTKRRHNKLNLSWKIKKNTYDIVKIINMHIHSRKTPMCIQFKDLTPIFQELMT